MMILLDIIRLYYGDYRRRGLSNTILRPIQQLPRRFRSNWIHIVQRQSIRYWTMSQYCARFRILKPLGRTVEDIIFW